VQEKKQAHREPKHVEQGMKLVFLKMIEGRTDVDQVHNFVGYNSN
jgi:hypothetical protein